MICSRALVFSSHALGFAVVRVARQSWWSCENFKVWCFVKCRCVCMCGCWYVWGSRLGLGGWRRDFQSVWQVPPLFAIKNPHRPSLQFSYISLFALSTHNSQIAAFLICILKIRRDIYSLWNIGHPPWKNLATFPFSKFRNRASEQLHMIGSASLQSDRSVQRSLEVRCGLSVQVSKSDRYTPYG